MTTRTPTRCPTAGCCGSSRTCTSATTTTLGATDAAHNAGLVQSGGCFTILGSRGGDYVGTTRKRSTAGGGSGRSTARWVATASCGSSSSRWRTRAAAAPGSGHCRRAPGWPGSTQRRSPSSRSNARPTGAPACSAGRSHLTTGGQLPVRALLPAVRERARHRRPRSILRACRTRTSPGCRWDDFLAQPEYWTGTGWSVHGVAAPVLDPRIRQPDECAVVRRHLGLGHEDRRLVGRVTIHRPSFRATGAVGRGSQDQRGRRSQVRPVRQLRGVVAAVARRRGRDDRGDVERSTIRSVARQRLAVPTDVLLVRGPGPRRRRSPRPRHRSSRRPPATPGSSPSTRCGSSTPAMTGTAVPAPRLPARHDPPRPERSSPRPGRPPSRSTSPATTPRTASSPPTPVRRHGPRPRTSTRLPNASSRTPPSFPSVTARCASGRTPRPT